MEQLTDGRTTESRLKAQGPGLATAIRTRVGSSGTVVTEEQLFDDGNRLWGTIDLLILGEQGVTVIDLKSGADAAKDPLPEEIRNQLLHYALLVRSTHGTSPALGVFSLRRGLRLVEQADGDLDSLLSQIEAARQTWMAGDRTADPSPEQCHFCRHRLECEPHWAAILEWDDPDATQGILRRVVVAANGSSALTLDNDVWISDVPAAMSSHLGIGQPLRGVRIRRSRRESVLEGQTNWHASAQSAFKSVAKASMST